MINVIFPNGLNEIKIPALYQWDYGRSLSITGVNTTNSIFQVHFFNKNLKKALVRIAYSNGNAWTVNIPNTLLQERHDVYAYIYLNSYERATDVTSSTEGSYYIENNGAYLEVKLPDEYVHGTAYYKAIGQTVKKVIIPIIPRKKPEDYPDNFPAEDTINELVRYCNNLDNRLDYYVKLVNQYTSTKLFEVVTLDEYNALVAAGKVDEDVLYCIEGEDLYAEMEEDVTANVTQNIREGINDGSIAIGNVEHAESADEATYATEAGDAATINGIEIFRDENSSLAVNGAEITVRIQDAETLDGYAAGTVYRCYSLNVDVGTVFYYKGEKATVVAPALDSYGYHTAGFYLVELVANGTIITEREAHGGYLNFTVYPEEGVISRKKLVWSGDQAFSGESTTVDFPFVEGKVYEIHHDFDEGITRGKYTLAYGIPFASVFCGSSNWRMTSGSFKATEITLANWTCNISGGVGSFSSELDSTYYVKAIYEIID